MTTLNKIAYDVAHHFGKQDDLSYIERLKFAIHGLRSTIIRRDLDRNRFTPQQYIQTIGCVDMEFVDASYCCGVEVGCKVFRSKKKLPYPIRFKDRVPFYWVGTINGKKEFAPMSFSELEYVKYSKYTSRKPRYYYQDGYIYLINGTASKITVKGVFEYPDQLAGFTDCGGNACYSDDSEYPISADLAHSIKETLKQSQNGNMGDGTKNEVKIDK